MRNQVSSALTIWILPVATKFIILTFLLTYSAWSYDLVCNDVEVNDPPFYISDEYKQGNKIWENFRNIKDSSIKDRFIPRGSIVFIDDELYEQSSSTNSRVPVRVLSVPNIKVENNLKKSKYRNHDSLKVIASETSNKVRVKKGDIGWMSKKSIKVAGKYTFSVPKDSPIYKASNIDTSRDYYLKLDMNNGKYLAEYCCTPDTAPVEEYCVEKYKMKLINDDGDELSSQYVNFQQCNFIEDSMPISDNSLSSVREILKGIRKENPDYGIKDLEILPAHQSWHGNSPTVVRDELIKIPIEAGTRKGPYGSYHYRGDDKVNSDAFMNPKPLCAFTKVLKQWQKECKGVGCQVQFGDAFHPRSWKGHSSHGTGDCIDIRPFRVNDDETINGLKYGWERYSYEKTKDFINLLTRAGGKKLYFNDPEVRKNTSAVKGTGHSDHIHVCFPKNDKKTKEVCENGIPIAK